VVMQHFGRFLGVSSMGVGGRVEDASREDVRVTFDRMVEIMSMARGTQHPSAKIEWSALMSAAAMCVAVSAGLPPTHANCARVLRLIVGIAAPLIEDEIVAMLRDNADIS
jgi:hypothetical protein